MANEITSVTRLTATKNGTTITSSTTARTDMSGDALTHRTQSIGTTAETVDFGDISGAPAVVKITNLDDTNFVELGGDSGLTVFKLKLVAGASCLIHPTSGTLYAKADTAAVLISTAAAEA